MDGSESVLTRIHFESAHSQSGVISLRCMCAVPVTVMAVGADSEGEKLGGGAGGRNGGMEDGREIQHKCRFKPLRRLEAWVGIQTELQGAEACRRNSQGAKAAHSHRHTQAPRGRTSPRHRKRCAPWAAIGNQRHTPMKYCEKVRRRPTARVARAAPRRCSRKSKSRDFAKFNKDLCRARGRNIRRSISELLHLGTPGHTEARVDPTYGAPRRDLRRAPTH